MMLPHEVVVNAEVRPYAGKNELLYALRGNITAGSFLIAVAFPSYRDLAEILNEFTEKKLLYHRNLALKRNFGSRKTS